MSNWIPCSEKLPEKDGWYLCSTKDKRVVTLYWYSEIGRWVNNAAKHIFETYQVTNLLGERIFYKENSCYDFHEHILAWEPLPEPY